MTVLSVGVTERHHFRNADPIQREQTQLVSGLEEDWGRNGENVCLLLLCKPIRAMLKMNVDHFTIIE